MSLCCTRFEAQLEMLLLDSIVDCLLSMYFDISDWQLPGNIPLADPSFNIPGEIEMLIGSDLFGILSRVENLQSHGSQCSCEKQLLAGLLWDNWIWMGQFPTYLQ